MNLLPYVLFFISILSLLSVGLFKGYQVTSFSNYFLHGYMVAERDARNTMEAETYARTQTSSPSSPSQDPSQKKEPSTPSLPNPDKPFTSFRSKRLTENSKLNIASLFFKEDPTLKNTLTTLLKNVYSHAPFMQIPSQDIDSLCHDLVESLISINKKAPLTELSLFTMRFPNETLAHVWYKMLRGTNPYHLEKKEGWPPLSTLLIIHPDKKRKPLCFKKASIPLLIAHFGEEAATEILEKERTHFLEGKGNRALSETDLDTILANHSLTHRKHQVQMNTLRNSPLITQGQDPHSGILVELSPLR
jgi:hypothetical protein